MKKNISLLLLLLSMNFIFAQSTYQSTYYATQDSTFLTSICNSATTLNTINFKLAGANQTWNCASIPIAEQKYENFLNPSSNGYRESFILTCILNGGWPWDCATEWTNLTNLGKNSGEDMNLGQVQFTNITNFYKKSSQSLVQNLVGMTVGNGTVPVPLTIEFSLADVVYKFPLSYNNKDTSISSYTLTTEVSQGSFTYKKWQKRINNIEGWGTVVTPYATFTNTLKLKTIIEHKDTTILNTTAIPVTYKEVVYSWFDVHRGIPVLEVKGTIAPMNLEIYTEAKFIDIQRCLDPQAYFFYMPFVPILNATNSSAEVGFTNLSNNADQYQWNFGDNQTSTQLNPTHTYTAAGNYSVKLIAKNNICNPVRIDSSEFLISIQDTADISANFSYSPQFPFLTDTIFFTSTALHATNIRWDFGDNSFSLEQNPKHIYTQTGNYTIRLIASNYSKSDTVFKSITVSPVVSIENMVRISNIKIIPNPVNDYFIVEKVDEQINTIEIIDLNGNIAQYFLLLSSNKVNVSKLNAGIYFVRITTKQAVYVEKIVKL